MSKAVLLADLRTILRHINRLPSQGINSFKAQTMAQFRGNMAITDKEEARNLRWKAHDAAQLVTALQVRKELLDLHAGEKMTQEERIRLAALRVGLNPPEVYDSAAPSAL
ncbi:unnamed protein product [Ectocarpus sp. CCAP 1310/34]|nr:unnamed protein product [Ectocarpus sp. CCAP 1310/34]